jgi:MFS family permease
MKLLIITIVLFFFTSSLSGSFLPIYFRDQGLSLAQICGLLLLAFVTLGILPFVLLRTIKNFERAISLGIFTTMLFFVALIYVREPMILGLAQGLSWATFWPSFNLLQLRLSEARARARTISLLSSVIPSLAGIAGPVTGGVIIEKLGFTSLFITSIVLYLIEFILSIRIHYEPVANRLSIPRNRTFTVFFASFIIAGLADPYFLAYPFFVYNISGTALNMGLVLTTAGILISTITFAVNWASDVKRTRVQFAVIGTALSGAWFYALGFATSMNDIIILSVLSGFANAFRISWFAHYGDSFGTESYPTMLVMMETGFMVGRVTNLVPTYFLISQANYTGYFSLLGTLLLSLIPLYLIVRKQQTRQNG